ncbi:MBL fold metallo-hydrolase [Halovivax gelatinilyticus]|uniref:MBL fold metallo-hydrolase n=1 Tax=Halovivax gelatinilyticus TaxID=2961597 RepID=UPI0020CA871A|nr:MBL fold metallo-hydrolase [Halovivax gelatinilyticus]
MTVSRHPIELDWLGYASIRLHSETGVTVYIDPGRYGVLDDISPRDGDLILVSHDDHYDPDGIERVAHEDAIVVAHEAIDASEIDRVERQPESLPFEIERVHADESFVLGPLDLFTTPAYNLPDGPHTREDGTPYHPEGTGCGFGITLDGVTVFWPGDTDALTALESLDVDVFCPPIGGGPTMDRHEAADLARAIEPELVVPVHYNTFEMIETDERAFVYDVASSSIPVALDA